MNKKELPKFFCYMFLAMCLIALIILGICSFFYYLIPIDFPGTVGEWIASLSTLAGGALTLGGVYWTIKHEEQERQNMNERQLELLDKEDFPFPLFDLSYTNKDIKKNLFEKLTTIDSFYYDFDEINSSNFLLVPLYAFNLNSTEIFDLCIRNIYIQFPKEDERNVKKYELIHSINPEKLTTIIPKGCKVKVELEVSLNDDFINDNIKKSIENHEGCNIYIVFEYKNKHSIKHSQEIAIHCDFLIKQDNFYRPSRKNYVVNVENIK